MNSIENIRIRKEYDTDPDLAYLKQYENATDPVEKEYYAQDQRRNAQYGDHWWMVGIYAEATIAIPGGGHSTLQTIRTPGLWGIESDSDLSHFEEVATENLAQLKDLLDQLNVDINDWQLHTHEALQSLDHLETT